MITLIKNGVKSMNCIVVKWTNVIISVVVAFFLTSVAWGTELSIPALKAKPGELVNIPIMIDLVDNLAGVKLVMKYDTEILTFKKAVKTNQTSSLMHIVNSKKPGTLIVVMAGAKGIKGKDFPIILLNLEVKKDLKSSIATKIEIHEVQMMTDQLKDIKCSIKVNPLAISADGQNDKKPVQGTEKPEQDVKKPEQSVKEPEQIVEKSEQSVKEPEQDVKKPEQSVKEPEQSVKEPEQIVEKSEQSVEKPEQDVSAPDPSAEKSDKNISN